MSTSAPLRVRIRSTLSRYPSETGKANARIAELFLEAEGNGKLSERSRLASRRQRTDGTGERAPRAAQGADPVALIYVVLVIRTNRRDNRLFPYIGARYARFPLVRPKIRRDYVHLPVAGRLRPRSSAEARRAARPCAETRIARGEDGSASYASRYGRTVVGTGNTIDLRRLTALRCPSDGVLAASSVDARSHAPSLIRRESSVPRIRVPGSSYFADFQSEKTAYNGIFSSLFVVRSYVFKGYLEFIFR